MAIVGGSWKKETAPGGGRGPEAVRHKERGDGMTIERSSVVAASRSFAWEDGMIQEKKRIDNGRLG